MPFLTDATSTPMHRRCRPVPTPAAAAPHIYEALRGQASPPPIYLHADINNGLSDNCEVDRRAKGEGGVCLPTDFLVYVWGGSWVGICSRRDDGRSVGVAEYTGTTAAAIV
jgi:hypothetical protein